MGQVQHLMTGAPVGYTREDQGSVLRKRMDRTDSGEPGAMTREARIAVINEWRGLQGLRHLSFFERLRVR